MCISKREFIEKVEELRSFQTLAKEAEDKADSLKVDIITYMKENNLDTEYTDNNTITYKPQTRKTLDKKKLENKLGDLSDYEKVTTYNVLRVK